MITASAATHMLSLLHRCNHSLRWCSPGLLISPSFIVRMV